MNLLIIPSWYISEKNPIRGVFFRDQALALMKTGHNVTVIDISFNEWKKSLDRKNFKLFNRNDNGIDTYSAIISPLFIPYRFFLARSLIYYLYLVYVYSIISKKGNSFHIIHAHSFRLAGYCSCKLSRKMHIPVVVTEHLSNLMRNSISWSERRLLKYTVDNSDTFICVSSALKEKVKYFTSSQKEIIVVPNLFRFDANNMNKAKISNGFVFFSAGNLIERKRFQFTIDCFAKAFKNNEDVMLLIAGDGVLKEKLQLQIAALNMGERIILLGQLDKKQMESYFAECDIFVLVSAAETFGVVYIEALAFGKPLIGAKNGGAEDIINGNNGILIDVDNEDQLVRAFQKIYADHEKYNGEKISSDCYNRYSPESIANILSDIFTRVVELYRVTNAETIF